MPQRSPSLAAGGDACPPNVTSQYSLSAMFCCYCFKRDRLRTQILKNPPRWLFHKAESNCDNDPVSARCVLLSIRRFHRQVRRYSVDSMARGRGMSGCWTLPAVRARATHRVSVARVARVGCFLLVTSDPRSGRSSRRRRSGPLRGMLGLRWAPGGQIDATAGVRFRNVHGRCPFGGRLLRGVRVTCCHGIRPHLLGHGDSRSGVGLAQVPRTTDGPPVEWSWQ